MTTAEPILLPAAVGTAPPRSEYTAADLAHANTAAELNALDARIRGHDWQSLNLSIQCGETLAKVRDYLKARKKSFAKWVDEHCQFTRSTAYYRVDLAECPEVRKRLAALDPSKDEPPSGRQLHKIVIIHRRNVARKEHGETVLKDIDPTIRVHHCEAGQLPVETGTANVVVIDPPWDREAVEGGIFDHGAKLAKQWLKPGGFALIYTSQDYLPAVIEQTGRHLTYCWPLVVGYAKNKNGYRLKRFKTTHHLVLLYSHGQPAEAKAKEWVHDLYQCDHDPDGKKWHKWQQHAAPLEYWLKNLCDPGELVADGFAGSGTTAAVCRRLKLHCVTGDQDPEAVKAVHARLNAERKQSEKEAIKK